MPSLPPGLNGGVSLPKERVLAGLLLEGRSSGLSGGPNSQSPAARHIRLCAQVQSEWEILNKESLMAERAKVSLERAKVIEQADPILLGPCTVVVPGAKDFSEIERALRTNNIESTKKKPKKAGMATLG